MDGRLQRTIGRWFLLALVAGTLVACRTTQAAALPFVDLSVRTPVPVVAATEDRPLRVAIAAILSPQGTVDSYRELAAYLGEIIGRPVEIVQRRTYAEVNALIAQDQVDLAFVCTSAYLDGQDDGSMELLVVPEIDGQTIYMSQLIVPTESPAHSMADLRGTRFAFTDPMSLSGRVYPTYLVQQLGSSPEAFFADISYTYSHERAIQAVADGVVDAAAVDSLVLTHVRARDPALAARIRIIHTSEPFGIPPVVIPSGVPDPETILLQQALLNMENSSIGRAVLAHLGVDRFIRVDESIYASARQLTEQVRMFE